MQKGQYMNEELVEWPQSRFGSMTLFIAGRCQDENHA